MCAGGSLASDSHDLRNLGAYYTCCSKEDILVLVSDGVHDNFDPQQLGFTPQELKIDVHYFAFVISSIEMVIDR